MIQKSRTKRYILENQIKAIKKLEIFLDTIEDNTNFVHPKYPGQIIKYNREFNTIIIESSDDRTLRELLVKTGIFQKRDIHIESGNWRSRTINFPHNQGSDGKRTINFFYNWSFFIQTRHELFINDSWKSAGRSGNLKACKRRILIEINYKLFEKYKENVLKIAQEIARINIRKWKNNWRKELNRGKISFNDFNSREKFWKGISNFSNEKKSLFKRHQEYLMKHNLKSLDEVLIRSLMNRKKLTNYNIMRVANRINNQKSIYVSKENCEKLKVTDILDAEILENARKYGMELNSESDYKAKGAASFFKCQIDFFQHYNPQKSPLLLFLGIKRDLIPKCEVEIDWGNLNDYLESNFDVTDFFAPDVVIRNKENNKILAIIQLKGKSQFESISGGGSSFIQMIELKKVEFETEIIVAFVHIKIKPPIRNNNGLVVYEWLSSKVKPCEDFSGSFKRINLRLNNLREIMLREPELDPIIPKNLCRRDFLSRIYSKILNPQYSYSKRDFKRDIDICKEKTLISQKRFSIFVKSLNEIRNLNKKKVSTYFEKIKTEFWPIIEKIGKNNELESPRAFYYEWEKGIYRNFIINLRKYLIDSI
ncbi:MAG: hypothetical protein ACFFAJ_12765 [Candidatus Hodarchaeota archaeon]